MGRSLEIVSWSAQCHLAGSGLLHWLNVLGLKPGERGFSVTRMQRGPVVGDGLDALPHVFFLLP